MGREIKDDSCGAYEGDHDIESSWHFDNVDVLSQDT